MTDRKSLPVDLRLALIRASSEIVVQFVKKWIQCYAKLLQSFRQDSEIRLQ